MNKTFFYAMILSLLTAIVGCTQDDGSSSDRNKAKLSDLQSEAAGVEREVQLNYNFTALRRSASSCATCRVDVAFTDEDVMQATLYVENLDDGEDHAPTEDGSGQGIFDAPDFEFEWSVFLDENFNAQSNFIVSLPVENLNGGTQYEFLLDVEGPHGGHYIGTAVDILEDTDKIAVDLTIIPVIGDIEVEVTSLNELGLFTLNYPGLDSLDLEDSNVFLELLVGDEDPAHFDIFDKEFFNGGFYYFFGEVLFDDDSNEEFIPDNGPHDITVNLLDGSILLAQAKELEFMIDPGTDIRMDLNPLHGEVAFFIEEEGSDTTATLNIPGAIIDEAGFENGNGSDLFITLDISGNRTDVDVTLLVGPDFTPLPDGSYSFQLPLEDIHLEEVSWALNFIDNENGDRIAWCIEEDVEIAFNDGPLSLECDVILRRRAAITGDTLAVLGVNVITPELFPLEDAAVFIIDLDDPVFPSDPQPVGFTGDALHPDPGTATAFGTAGFLEVWLELGKTYGIVAVYDGPDPTSTDTSVTVELVGGIEEWVPDKFVDNLNIKLCPSELFLIVPEEEGDGDFINQEEDFCLFFLEDLD